MEIIIDSLGNAINYISTIRLSDVVDILIVAFLIYKLIMFVRKTNTYNIAKGVLLLLVVLLVSQVFKLNVINYLIRKTVELGLIAIVVLFQPELRRLLERFGSSFASGKVNAGSSNDMAITQVTMACSDMSASRTGALIIFERKATLGDVVNTGTIVNADVNAELIKNLFFNKAPLHDGALIIKDGRILAAGCVLPLTKQTNLSKELGTRHRAGIGLSEQSDAVVIIVSEESGAISVAMDGMLKRHLSSESLEKILRAELIDDNEETKKNFWDNFVSAVSGVIKNENK